MSLASFAHQEVLLKNLFMRVSNFIATALIVALLGVNECYENVLTVNLHCFDQDPNCSLH